MSRETLFFEKRLLKRSGNKPSEHALPVSWWTSPVPKKWAVVYLIGSNLDKKHHCLHLMSCHRFFITSWCHCRCHPKDINNVVFHRSYPLFASCSDDCTAYVFHGMVYSDLNKNPLIVPLEILRGHANSNGRGILDCKFHPRQPWLFTAGADKMIKLYCHQ